MIYFKLNLKEPIRFQRKDFKFNYYGSNEWKSFHKKINEFSETWLTVSPTNLVEWNDAL